LLQIPVALSPDACVDHPPALSAPNGFVGQRRLARWGEDAGRRLGMASALRLENEPSKGALEKPGAAHPPRRACPAPAVRRGRRSQWPVPRPRRAWPRDSGSRLVAPDQGRRRCCRLRFGRQGHLHGVPRLAAAHGQDGDLRKCLRVPGQNRVGLADVWEFDPTTGQWTGVNGFSRGNTPTVSHGVGAPGMPGSGGGIFWADKTGAIWLSNGIIVANTTMYL
jgi:hypothetical protein